MEIGKKIAADERSTDDLSCPVEKPDIRSLAVWVAESRIPADIPRDEENRLSLVR